MSLLLTLALLVAALAPAEATVAVSSLYGSNMVIQRGKVFPIHGTAAPNKVITVVYGVQTNTTTSDAQGNWQVFLPAMSAQTNGSSLTITENGANTITLSNVVVGDVWLCSGQSNMAFTLGSCKQTADVNSANFPGMRFLTVPSGNLSYPSNGFSGPVSWSICGPLTSAGFSATAFYFGRSIFTNQNGNIPIGLIVSSVGGTTIDRWLAPEGVTDIPALSPLFNQSIANNGPFSLFNGMIYPLASLPVKGVIWYQGENGESTTQSADSYYLKLKGLIAGWKRLLGMSDCAFYLVQIANWGTQPSSATPVLTSGGWNADTRLQQGYALNLPRAGVASAIDIGDSGDMHPTNKWDVGGRLALWAMKNEYGQTNLVTSGPVLRETMVSGNIVTCTFDHAGGGLMAGYKPVYGTAYATNVPLSLFSIAGADGVWWWATATISGSNTVELTSSNVASPRMVAYACWQSPVGANLYNSNGLPALPFYVTNITARYTIAASAGMGGSISPSGSSNYLQRMTALYTITPDPGYYVQNLQVDGTNVSPVAFFNSAAYYTFDPLYANHTIAATFTNAMPTNSITATASGGGALNPSGTVNVEQGGARSFEFMPFSGLEVALTVDGYPVGARDSFTFSDVTVNHTIAATFSTKVMAYSGFGGNISSPGITSVTYGSNVTYNITPWTNYSILKVLIDGTNVGAPASYTFTNVTSSHIIEASFAGGGSGGSVPQSNKLFFACLVDSLQTNSSGIITAWPTYSPSGSTLAPMGASPPTLARIDGRPFAMNSYASSANGFNQGAYVSPVPCSGASVVVVAKPIRNGINSSYNCVVDAFYNQLSLGVLNDTGQIFVLRNGSAGQSVATIPDGQTTILSLVVQSNGQYAVWANGSLMYTNNSVSTVRALTNGVAGAFANNITIGNNYPDSWSTFSGYIGDVFFYTNALSDTDRILLEQYIATRLLSGNGTNLTVTATAGAGGMITPAGGVIVPYGSNQSFTITPSNSYSISNVVVDGIVQGATASYIFTNVVTNHTITATFAYNGHTITAGAGLGGSITPGGIVPVAAGSNQSFAINANLGGSVSNVLVDGISQGPITSYTFTNVTADHTISALFNYANYTITATAEGGGGIAPSGGVLVLNGTSQGFTIVANPGYAISNVVVDSVSQGAISSYTFNAVTNNHSITATFSLVAAQGGIISVNYCQSNDALTTTNIAGKVPTNHWNNIIRESGAGPFPNYQNPTNAFFDCGGNIVSGFRVTLSGSGGNTWNTGGAGDKALFADWCLDISGAGASGTVTFTNIPYPQYDLYVYLSTYGSPNSCSYIIGTVTNLLSNTMGSPNNFASFGYVAGNNFVKFTGLTNQSPVMTVKVVSGYNLGMAAFQIVQTLIAVPSHTITPSAGSGGIVAPSTPQIITNGNNATFTITPNPGFAISNVVVDSASFGPISSYTFTNVTASHTISAAFVSLPPPTLSIAPNGSDGIDITWPDTYAGTLLTSPVLGPGVTWIPVGIAPAHIGSLLKITVTPGVSNAFYVLSY